MGCSSYTPDPNFEVSNDPLVQAVAANGLPPEFVPTYIPEGFSFAENEPIHSIDTEGFIRATGAYYKSSGPNAYTFLIDIAELYNPDALYTGSARDNSIDPDTHYVDGRIFYIYPSEDGRWAAEWSDGKYRIYVGCLEDREDLIRILNSIPEVS